VDGNGRLMRAAGIETFGGEMQMLELAAPQSLAPDEVVIAVRAAGVGNWDEIVRVGGWASKAPGPSAWSPPPRSARASEVVPASSGESVLVHGVVV
jgi:NADPH:quinone reductase-like Zn-dependent oxidoreductase